MNLFWTTFLATISGVIAGGCVTAAIGYIFQRRLLDIQQEFQKKLSADSSAEISRIGKEIRDVIHYKRSTVVIQQADRS